MRTTRRGMRAIALAMGLLLALTLGSVVAWADRDSGLGGANSILAQQPTNATDESLASSEVAYDVYKIASATKDGTYDTYNYSFDVSDFASLQAFFFDEMDGSKWQTMADEGAKLVKDKKPDATGVAGEALTGLSDGLFLVIAHTTNTQSWSYSFNPTVVALPTKAPLKDDEGNVIVDENGYPIIGTSVEYGEWLTQADITLKYAQAPRYGSLVIEKHVDGFEGEPATFVFHITGMQPDGTPYDNYASVYYDGTDPAMTIVPHIMAGTTVTVTEVYAGGRYQASRLLDETATIEADEEEGLVAMSPISVHFDNVPTGPDPQGHGIENGFTYDGETGDWEWVATPADEASPATTE